MHFVPRVRYSLTTMSADFAHTTTDDLPPISQDEPDSGIHLLDEWLEDESGAEEKTWPEFRIAFERSRPLPRKRAEDE